MNTQATKAAALSFDCTGTDRTELLDVAETIAAAQRAANACEATANGVWYALRDAMTDTLTMWFRANHESTAQGARAAAEAVVSELYVNGESVAWNVQVAVSHLYA